MANHKVIKWCWLLVDMSGWSKQEHDVHYQLELCYVKLLIDNNVIIITHVLTFFSKLQFTALVTMLGPSPKIFMPQWRTSAARLGAGHEDFSDEHNTGTKFTSWITKLPTAAFISFYHLLSSKHQYHIILKFSDSHFNAHYNYSAGFKLCSWFTCIYYSSQLSFFFWKIWPHCTHVWAH